MPRAIDNMVALGPESGKHIDAYQEYTSLVGRLDGGRPLPEPVYEELRKRAADGSKRLYVYWRHTSGLDCRAIGPQSMCFCGHRYNEHDWSAFDTRQVRCKMPGCTCTCFNYVPVRGSQDLKCSRCHKSYTEHNPNHGCPGVKGTKFASSYTCSCTASYNEHETVFESREERARAGRPLDTGWMQKAEQEGLPVCHLGGITGFTSLADGIDRVYAGLEEGYTGGGLPDAGADRILQRLRVEDEVNTASVVHGRTAGLKAIADSRTAVARQQGRGAAALPSTGGGGSSSSSCASGLGARGRSASVGAAPARPPGATIATLGGGGVSRGGGGGAAMSSRGVPPPPPVATLGPGQRLGGGGGCGRVGTISSRGNPTSEPRSGQRPPPTSAAAAGSTSSVVAAPPRPPRPRSLGTAAMPASGRPRSGGPSPSAVAGAGLALAGPGHRLGSGRGQRTGPPVQRGSAEALRQARLAHFDAS